MPSVHLSPAFYLERGGTCAARPYSLDVLDILLEYASGRLGPCGLAAQVPLRSRDETR